MPGRVLIPLLLVLIGAKLAVDHLADVDLFWHLRLGLDILSQHALPTKVDYSWTAAAAPYVANDWLAQVLLAAVYDRGGFPGLALLKALTAAALVLFTYGAALERSGRNMRASGLATAVLVFVAATSFATRPLLFGHLCLAAEIYCLERAASGHRKALLAIPILFALWINLHGTWPVGFGPLVALTAASFLPLAKGRFITRTGLDGLRKPLLRTLLASAAALCVNPNGVSSLLRPFKLLGRKEELSLIDEWSPVPLSDPSAWIFFASVLLLVFAAVRSKRPLPLLDLGLTALTFLLSLTAARYQIAYALITAPLLAHLLAGLISPEGFESTGMNAVTAAAAAFFLGLIALVKVSAWSAEVRTIEPVDAVEALVVSKVRGEPGFHRFEWGGFLVFHQVPTFVDGRLEPFLANGMFKQYVDVQRRADLEWLEQQGVRWLLLTPDAPLAKRAEGREGWTREFEDAGSVLWVRN